MKRGDPFETAELDEQRARQRRDLRSIPERYFRLDQGAPTLPKVDAGERAWIELELRDLADRIRPSVAERLEAIEQKHKRRAAVNYASALGSEVPAFNSLVNQLSADEQGWSLAVEADVRDLSRYGWLLAVADGLAQDGYEDPRFRGLHMRAPE